MSAVMHERNYLYTTNHRHDRIVNFKNISRSKVKIFFDTEAQHSPSISRSNLCKRNQLSLVWLLFSDITFAYYVCLRREGEKKRKWERGEEALY